MEACWAHNPEVRRSKLRSAKIFVDTLGVPLAQRIARWTSNPKVLGSIPRWDGTTFWLFLFPQAFLLLALVNQLIGRLLPVPVLLCR